MIAQITLAADGSRRMLASGDHRTRAGVACLAMAVLSALPVAASAQRSERGREKPAAVRVGASAAHGPLRREFYDSPAGFVEVSGSAAGVSMNCATRSGRIVPGSGTTRLHGHAG